MKIILGLLAAILAISFIGFLLPAIIGVVIGILMIGEGSIVGGIVAIIIGIVVNIAMLYGSFAEGGASGGLSSGADVFDEECPFCGSGDTDGNHCYTCEKDF